MPYIQGAGEWLSHFKVAFDRFQVITDTQQCHFLAQCAAETGEFQHLEESLNYSATRLMAVWPARFNSPEVATVYASNPARLGNLIYQGKYGNDTPGDGYKYRGRGCFMTTFKANYATLQKALGLPIVSSPGLLLTPQNAVNAAGAFWQEHKLNTLADIGDLVGITRAINGGVNGLGQRAMYLSRLEQT